MEKMEKIMDREIAWRVFAHEFNMSNLYVSEGDERAPNYIITPTGVKCNRLFIIGVVTEVENIGKDNNLWRARIADPTGVFTIYAGQYQPEAAIFLSELQVPAYVALVGKARKYEPEDGSVYLSVRPEEINAADETQRDRWVLDTAERTLERIKIIDDALKSGLSGNELQEFLAKKVKNAALINGVTHAIRHYKNLDKTLLEIKKTLVHAVKTVASDSGIIKPPQKQEQSREHDVPGKTMDEFKTHERSFEKINKPMADEQILEEMDRTVEEINEIIKETQIPAEPETKEPHKLEPKEVLAAIIDELDTGKGTSFSKVIETAHAAGMDAETVESSIKELMDEGRCYEPKIGVLRKV
jgi:RPA family protein